MDQLPAKEFVVYSDHNGADAIIKRVFDSPFFIHMMLGETQERRMSNLSKGTIQLIIQNLQQTPQSQWQAKLKQLQPEFGFDLTLVARQTLDINAIKLAQFDRTGMTWLINEDNETEIYQATQNKNLVLKIGPIPVPDCGICRRGLFGHFDLCFSTLARLNQIVQHSVAIRFRLSRPTCRHWPIFIYL